MSNVSGGVAGGASGHGLSVSAEGVIELPGGAQADLTTSEGVAIAKARLDAGQLAELEGMMAAQGYRLEGAAFVADDAFARGSTARRAGGPQSSRDGRTDLDDEVRRVFTDNGIADPYNANTLPALERRIGSTGEFATAAEALTRYYADPSPANAKAAAEALDALAVKHGVGTNIMEVLYLVFRESIRDSNEDKKYFLLKLQDYNKMAEDLSKYLDSLSNASQRLSARALKMGDDGHKATVDVEIRDYDLTTLDEGGNLQYDSRSKPLQREELNLEIKRLESAQETIRNERQVASTSFQNFDQKSNQLFNMMSTVLKIMNDMRSSTVRNML